MIKSEIRSIFRNLLPKQDKTNKWHDKVIDAAIEKVLSEIYNEVFFKNPTELQRYTKEYGYTTALVITSEATTGLYYTALPAAIIPFPDKASGVRRISTPIQGGMMFFPIDAREMDYIKSGSYTDSVTSKIGYLVTPTRIEFYNVSGAVLTSGCRMDLIIPFSVYTDTDTVPIPEVARQDGQTFIDRVLRILGVVRPVDNKDDNSDPKIENNEQ